MKNNASELLIGFTVLISAVMVVSTFWVQGFNEDALRETLRETARISFILFLVVFLASPLYALNKNSVTQWLIQNRRYLGLSFGVSHLIHLVLIIALVLGYSEGELSNIATSDTYLMGGLGYLFIFAMMMSSNDGAVKRLGRKRWKLLHRVGMYFLFVSFLMSFIGLLDKDQTFYLPFVVAILFAGGVRMWVFYKKEIGAVRKRRSLG